MKETNVHPNRNTAIAASYPRIAGDSHILFQPITALTAVGPNRSLASRQAIVWTYRPRVEATES